MLPEDALALDALLNWIEMRLFREIECLLVGVDKGHRGCSLMAWLEEAAASISLDGVIDGIQKDGSVTFAAFTAFNQ